MDGAIETVGSSAALKSMISGVRRGDKAIIVGMSEVSSIMRRGFLWAAEGKELYGRPDAPTYGTYGNGKNRVYTGMGDSE